MLRQIRLDSALEASIDWLQANRHQFSMRLGASKLETILLLKPFSELVLCLKVLAQNQIEVSQHAEWAWSEVDSGDLILQILLARPDLLDLASVIVSFDYFGLTNEKLTSMVRHLAELRSTNAAETAPWCQVATSFNLHHLEIEHERRMMDRSDQWWISSLPESWIFCDASLYSVTHEIFYLTDFGNCPSNVPYKIRNYLELWMPAWAQCVGDEENWDLLGELLMVRACIDMKEDLGVWQPFLDAQMKNGAFPGPVGAGRSLINASMNLDRRDFLSSYHTCLVATMAIAMNRN